ncbi:MAG: 1-acyl-sn-glycerol-3-phosphate acyltransferase [Alphaproteobacteria bacterium]|nr:1-acyl-sn-glycerol-3-phosphate acyltransferase [Alphaproteobacteria bacterium]
MNNVHNYVQTASGIVKAIIFLAMVVILVPVALVYKRLRPQDGFRLPMLFHKLTLRLLGMRVRVHGDISAASPTFFVANHASYLDIPVLGSLLAASFVAKSEVAGWPLFGFLSKVQNTIFIERRAARAADQREQLQDQLAQRRNIILFPEGTSSDGMTALPFKSSLFAIVEDCAHDIATAIQPVSVTCTELDGFPLLREERPLYAWYGDMTLGKHLWQVFRRGHFTIDVIFHPSVTPAAFDNRKALATACQDMVARGIERSLNGRKPLGLLDKE